MRRHTLIITALSIAGLLYAEKAINFSHALHVQEMELECSQCHASAVNSEKGTDDLFNFDHDACYDCHSDAIDESCETCHTNVDDNPTFPRITDLMPGFSHKAHLSGGGSCSICHEGISEKEAEDVNTVASFSTCAACHEEKHIVPASHRVNWESLHGRETAGLAVDDCMACHEENYCINCHEGDNTAFQVHPQNFIMLHKLEFRSGSLNCETCHDPDDCLSCHKANAVRPLNHSSGNWVNFSGGGNHAMLAVSRIEYCNVCHESETEDPVCIMCHK